ncbi:growth-regulating factor 4-like isoform X2 [Actinidia eriantha]|uniref:growth-regulating factor 4-like isoform X2 n=1 Tax=Actinidia eriantha TaxID=165200 RepID=UPI00258E7000|nr:growth-regulating factor 4-like isoform X2 [Actinidia eriantha]
MAMNSASMVAAEGDGIRSSSSPFTGSQWQELEHQALIFKYLMAGIPVPPHLLLPIQKSFHAVSTAFFNDPSRGYCSLYGKKVDPEPGRCRRTDGKKWRCSKDAYPDSKYCERHIHRGRNRSRKPVESQVVSQSSSSTVTSLAVTEINSSSSGAGSFQNLPLHTFGNSQGPSAGSNQFQLHLESIPYGVPHKDYRYLHGLKPQMGEHSSCSAASGSNRGLQMDSPLANAWPLMPSGVSLFPTTSKANDNSIMQNDYPQHFFFSNEFSTGENAKQEGQSVRPFFDKWPKTRDTWSALEDEKSNPTSFSATQLSISTPMASSEFSTSSSQSPHGCQ